MPKTQSTPPAAANNTAPSQPGAEPRLISAVSADGAAPQFKIPVSSQAIQSVESVDLDLVLTTTTGEKIILQQGALQAATAPDSKIVFQNGDSITAADQIKKLGVLKPVEGGSFRLKSGDASPAVAELVTGDGFGLGKELQDTMSQLTETSKQLEKVLQTLSTATLSNTADDSKPITAGPGTGTGVQKITPQSENKFASPSPGSPPQPEVEKFTSNNTDSGNLSNIKITSTLRGLYGAPETIISNVRVVDKIQSEQQGKEVLKAFSQASLREMLPSDPLQVRVSGSDRVALEPNGLAHNTLVMPGVLNASSIRFELPQGTVLPDGFQIAGQTFSGSSITIAAESLKDLNLAIQWKVADLGASITKTDFQLGVKYLDNKGAELEQGRAPLTFTYGELKTIEDTIQLDGNSNTKIFLSAYGYSYDILGDDSNNNIAAGNGNDTLDGGAGADLMAGGAGHDTYVVDNTGDIVTEAADAGTDLMKASVSYTLSANVENLTLTGSDNLSGTGNALDNTITGNSGNNRLDGGEGADSMSGGAGNDTYVVDNTGDVITEALNAGTDTVEASVNHALSDNVENLILTGTEPLDGTGNELANTLTGNSANNRLDGGAGTDSMRGGAGDDTYVVDNIADVVTENLNEGADTIETSVTYTLSANVENLTLTGNAVINGTGNELNNVIIGNSANNRLDGGSGTDSMRGGAGDDTYVVDNIADVVTENLNEGADTIEASVTYTLSANVENLTLTGNAVINGTGNELNNVIIGNSANNRLDGGSGTDSMRGGAGDDTYVVDNIADVVTENLNEGADTIEASVTYTLSANVENLTLTGNAGINGTGNELNNVIIGNSANNRLDGGSGADTMRGGAGDDTYVVDNIADVVTENLNEGADTIEASVTYTLSANVENLTLTGTGHINGSGNELANAITGNSGNNRLDGGEGADSMRGGAGDDTYVVDNIADVVTENLNEGADTIEASVTYTLSANVDNLTLTGNAVINGTGNELNNVIIGNSANNRLDGGSGADTMRGGAGDDTYVVDNIADVVTENLNEGADTIEASVTYTLSANVDNLTLTGTTAINGTGNELNNVIVGNSANNRLDGGSGADTMRGGAGDDTYVVDNIADVVTENLNEGADTIEASVTYTLSANVENLTLTGNAVINGTGNELNNVIVGNSANNRLDGGAGADILIGGDGNDVLNGDDGGDLIFGGAGADTIDGGTGNDTASYSGSNAAVTVNLTNNTASGGHAQGDVLSNIENLIGSSAHGDTLTGNSGVNRIEGGGGNDTLDGGGGADTLLGGTGDDTYIINNTGVTITENAGEGKDTVISSLNDYTLGASLENLVLNGSATKGTGNDFNNEITGNGNNNHLIGGVGNDTLVINANGLSSGTFDGGTGTDTLKILASAGAIIDLRGIDSNKFISIEALDLTAQNNNILKLDLNTIKSLVDNASGIPTLSVKLGTGDTIDFVADTGQQVFNHTTSKTMTIFGASGTSLEQLAIINYA